MVNRVSNQLFIYTHVQDKQLWPAKHNSRKNNNYTGQWRERNVFCDGKHKWTGFTANWFDFIYISKSLMSIRYKVTTEITHLHFEKLIFSLMQSCDKSANFNVTVFQIQMTAMCIDFSNATLFIGKHCPESLSAELFNCVCYWDCYSQYWKGLKLTETNVQQARRENSLQLKTGTKKPKPTEPLIPCWPLSVSHKEPVKTVSQTLLLCIIYYYCFFVRCEEAEQSIMFFYICTCYCTQRTLRRAKRAGPRPKSKPTCNARVCGRFSMSER